MKLILYVCLVMTIVFASCGSEQGDNVAAATHADQTPAPISDLKEIPKNLEKREDVKVQLNETAKKNSVAKRWNVGSWASEELKNILGDDYEKRVQEEMKNMYELNENYSVNVIKDGETINTGKWSVSTGGRDMKLIIGDKKFVPRISFLEEGQLSLTWEEEMMDEKGNMKEVVITSIWENRE